MSGPGTTQHREELRFEILGRSFVWGCGDPLERRLLETYYRRFLVSNEARTSDPRGGLRAPKPESGDPGRRSLAPAIPDETSRAAALQGFAEHVHDTIDTHLLLHAGALEKDGRVLLLGGPSTFGKTTLTLRLVAEGFRFLGDDIAPMHRGTGRIAPFPRAVGLRPGSSPALDALARSAWERGSALGFEEKIVFDIEELFPGSLGEEAESGVVVLLSGSESAASAVGTTSHRVRLALKRRASEFLCEVGSLPGVTIECCAEETAPASASQVSDGARAAARSEDRPQMRDSSRRTSSTPAPVSSSARSSVKDPGHGPHSLVHLVRLDSGVGASVPFDRLCGGHRDVVRYVAPAESPGSFEGRPMLVPIDRSEAAIALVRDLLNRRPGGALYTDVGGRPERLVLEAAAHLRTFDCWKLRVGAISDSLALLRRLI